VLDIYAQNTFQWTDINNKFRKKNAMICVIRSHIRSVGLHRWNVANNIGGGDKGTVHPRTGHVGPKGE